MALRCARAALLCLSVTQLAGALERPLPVPAELLLTKHGPDTRSLLWSGCESGI